MAADLITVAEYKTFAGINSTESDTIFQSAITKISALVKAYCGRSFIDYYNTDKIEYHNPDPILMLEEMPVKTITSVEGSVDMGQTYTAIDEYTGFVLDRKYDNLRILNPTAYSSFNGIRVTYKAGFPYTPDDLKLAIFDLMQYYLKKESTKRKDDGKVSLEFQVDANFPAHIRRVLDLYRVL